MKRNVWMLVLVAAVVTAMAVPAVAGEVGRSEVAPGMPAPPDGGDTSALGRAAWPGPDGYGNTGSICTYDWVDITGTGTAVLLGDDDEDGPFPIGFSFPFYGASFTDFYTGSNGIITFGAGSTALSNQCPLPSSSTPDNLIALLWDDLDPGDTSDPVYYETFATCPVGTGQCLVVLYDDFCHYPGGASCDTAGTFQAILYESGKVWIQFLDAGAEEGSGSTTGVEGADAASDFGLSYACDTAASLGDNLCLEIGLVPGINLGPDEISGATCPGDTMTVNMSLINNSGASATFALSYAITTGNATISGPPSITVDDGVTGSFDVDITPDLGLGQGTPISGSIDAVGGGYSDASSIGLNISVVADWLPLANTPAGVRYHATAYHGGDVYQIGGETGWWTATDVVQRYNTATDTWDTPASLPAGVYGTGAATIGDNIYVVGGSQCTEDTGDGCTSGTFTDAVQIFDTVAGTWSTDAGDPLPVALAYHSVVTDGSLIYVLGGETVAGALVDTVYIYDPAAVSGSRWTTGASMTTARAYAASGVIGGSIYIAGGWLGGTTMTDTVEVYDIAAGTWSAGPAMPAAVAPYGGGALDNLLISFAAEMALSGSTTYTCSPGVYALDTAAGTWGPLADLPRCLYGTEGVSDGAVFYDISGRTNEDGWHMALENQVTDICGPIPVEIMRLTIE